MLVLFLLEISPRQLDANEATIRSIPTKALQTEEFAMFGIGTTGVTLLPRPNMDNTLRRYFFIVSIVTSGLSIGIQYWGTVSSIDNVCWKLSLELP